jgi:hypothetical protein
MLSECILLFGPCACLNFQISFGYRLLNLRTWPDLQNINCIIFHNRSNVVDINLIWDEFKQVIRLLQSCICFCLRKLFSTKYSAKLTRGYLEGNRLISYRDDLRKWLLYMNENNNRNMFLY